VCIYIYIYIYIYKLSLLYACNGSKLPLDDVYHILVILLQFLHWVIDYQLTFSKIDDYEYPVKVVHRDISRWLGLTKIKGAHLHVNYIYNSLEVVGEEYSSNIFLVHEEPHKIRTHVIDDWSKSMKGLAPWKQRKDQQIQEYCRFFIWARHLEPAYNESIDKYVCKDYYYIDMLESSIKTKKYLQTKAANERFV